MRNAISFQVYRPRLAGTRPWWVGHRGNGGNWGTTGAVARVPQILLLALALVAATPPTWSRDPALARLFTPLAVPPGTYTVYTTPEAIQTLTEGFKARDRAPAPGAWEPSRPEAHGAFGQDGAYDRARLVRLFNGKRVTVVRGSLVDNGQRLAYTLVSPYPDATLARVVEATMIIEFRVPPLADVDAGRRN